MQEPMSSIAAVCRVQPRLAALPHVMRDIDAFLWPGLSQWTLESASKRGFVRLLDRLVKHERPEHNRRGREVRLNVAIKEAVQSGYDIGVLKWWAERYLPDLAVISHGSVFELAIEHANMLALEWLYEETRGLLPLLKNHVPCFDPDIIIWLHERGGYHSCSHLSLNDRRCRWTGSTLMSIRQCLAYEDSSFSIVGVETAVRKAIELKDLDTLQWIHVYRSNVFLPQHLNCTVIHGNLEAAKWLLQTFPTNYFDSPDIQISALFDPSRCRLDLDYVQWMENEFEWIDANAHIAWLNGVIIFAAAADLVEMLAFAFNTRAEIIKINADVLGSAYVASSSLLLMDIAASKGSMAIVQWLHDHHVQGCATEAMDEADSQEQ